MKTLIKELTNIQIGLFAKLSGFYEIVYLQSKHFDKNGQLLRELHPDLMAERISEKHLLKYGYVLFAAKLTKNFAAVFENHNEPSVAYLQLNSSFSSITNNLFKKYFISNTY